MAAVAYTALQTLIVTNEGKDSTLAQAVGQDWKGKASILCYAAAIGVSLVWPPIAHVLYVVVALIWLIPDRRIERVLYRRGQQAE